jgi:hypothetical protein
MADERVESLNNVDKILVENLALAEENAKLRAQIDAMKLDQKKLNLRAHLAQRFKIDLENSDISIDGKTAQLKIAAKNGKAPTPNL